MIFFGLTVNMMKQLLYRVLSHWHLLVFVAIFVVVTIEDTSVRCVSKLYSKSSVVFSVQ